jgi:4,5-DOPA dioxygenase extradiol
MPSVSSLPTLFLSHGAPTFAIDPGRAGEALTAVVARIPRPKAILAVSAHWETARPAVSGAVSPKTIHDFFGFPKPLYDIRYPAPGAPDLAKRVADLISAAGQEVDIDASRGLDHGAWVPLRHMYPHADIPIAQLSIQPHLGAAHHLRMGRALAALTDEGVLIVGSGSLTHNLGELRMQPEDTTSLSYVTDFQNWIAARVMARDDASLVRYRELAPSAARAHPTEDHILPFHVALGAAAGAERHERLHAGVTFGVIGMDDYAFGAERLAA